MNKNESSLALKMEGKFDKKVITYKKLISPQPKIILKKNINISNIIKEKTLEEKCEELKKISEKIHKANKKKIKENKIKDDEIERLNNEIEKYTLSNFELESEIEKKLEQRIKLERNQKKYADYCNTIKIKYKNFSEIMIEYQNEIKKMKEETEKIKEEYENKIKQIDQENNQLENEIKNKTNLCNKQEKIIKENEQTIRSLERQIHEQKDAFQARSLQNKNSYEELENKYSFLQRKIYELQMNCEIGKRSGLEGIKNENKNEDEIEVIEKEIIQYQKSNELLNKQLEQLNIEWNQLQEKVKADDKKNKFRIKFNDDKNRTLKIKRNKSMNNL